MIKNIGIAWELLDRSGWGVYGINLAIQLKANHSINPVLLYPPAVVPEHPIQAGLLEPLIRESHKLETLAAQHPGREMKGNLTVLCALGDGFNYSKPPIKGNFKIGVIFFEDTRFSRDEMQTPGDFDLIIAGSTWNRDVLKDMGVNHVQKVIQGIDPTIFHPAPRANYFGDRFVVFSGGKLEYRKGQDIVIAAFKTFHQRHPEALLLASWFNSWPTSMQEINTKGHVHGFPADMDDQKTAMDQWLMKNGLPQDSFRVVPDISNIYMGSIVREAHVGLFTNRAEGGTNLVAMECLASGVPVIMSANTGHLDFAGDELCLPLKNQGPVRSTPSKKEVEQWGETDVEEAVEALENVYTDYSAAKKRSQVAAEYMLGFSWQNQIRELVEKLDDYF